MKITEMVDEPENYHTWKRMAIKIDRKLHLANSIVAKPISLPKPPIIPKQSNPTLEKRDSTGVTFGGRGARFIFKVEVGVARPLKCVGSVGGERRYGAAGASRSVG